MSAWFGRSFGAMAVALSMAAMGCGGGSDGPTFPNNTIEFNGVQVPTDSPPQDVTYDLDQRWVYLYAADGSYVELGFQDQGDPDLYELPLGHFTASSVDLVSITVCLAGPGCATYYAPEDVSGYVDVGGDETSRILDIAGSFGLDNGATADEIVFSYTGSYDYLAD